MTDLLSYLKIILFVGHTIILIDLGLRYQISSTTEYQS